MFDMRLAARRLPPPDDPRFPELQWFITDMPVDETQAVCWFFNPPTQDFFTPFLVGKPLPGTNFPYGFTVEED